MSVVKIRVRRQVTIPRKIFDQLHLEVGDFVEAKSEDRKIVMIPKKLVAKSEVTSLSKKEQKALLKAKAKIEQINKDLARAKGLNKEEMGVAVKVGLISPDQAWWWTEEWQKGERSAEKEIKEGTLRGPFKTLDEFKTSLRSQNET